MRTFIYSLLSLFVPLAMTAQVSLTTAGLDKNKVYSLQTARGGWYANGTKLVSTTTAGATMSASDSSQWFAFVPSPTDSNTVFLYSVKYKKFVKSSAALVASGGDRIYIWNNTGSTTNPLFFSFTSDKSNYNINIGGAKQITIDTWKAYDDGNKVKAVVVENASYDLEEAQTILSSFSISGATQGYQTTGYGNDTWLIRALISGKASGETKLNKAFVTLKGNTLDNIKEVRLYTNKVEGSRDSSNFYLFGIDSESQKLTPIATAVPTSNQVELDIDNYVIPAGVSQRLWLNVVIKDSATFGATVDASLDSVNYDDNKSLVLNLDPDGSSKIFKVWNAVLPWWSFDTKIYRIPAMVQANDGTIVIAADDRRYHGADAGSGPDDIVFRYSTDYGKTWTPRKTMALASGNKNQGIYSYGDPALGKASNGDIILLTCATDRGFFSGQTSPWIYRSTDNGHTWDSGRTINTESTFTDNFTQGPGHKGFGGFSFFVTSGRLINTSSNRLMAVCPVYAYQGSALTNNIIYSDDNGHTWTMDDGLVWASGGNEAKVVERKDHTILASIRQVGRRGFNTATSDGMRWVGQYNAQTLPDPGVDEDIIAYGDSSMLIHTSLVAGRRADFRIYTSHDQGATWVERLQVQPGGSGYTTMEVLDNGDLAIFFEDATNDDHGYDMTYISIPKEVVKDWEAAGTATFPDYHERVQNTYGNLFADNTPTTGYFTMSEQTRNSILPLYNQYSQSCNLDQYFAFQDAISEADFNYPPTGYYRLKNAMRSSDTRYGWLNTTSGLNNTLSNTGAESVVKLTRQDDGKYTIAIQGQYIQVPTQSRQVSLGNTPVAFTPRVSTPGQVAFMGSDNGYSGLHTAASQSFMIVGWTETAGASQWVVEDAEQINVSAQSIGGKSYATLYVPFATQPASGRTFAATMTGLGDGTSLVRQSLYTSPDSQENTNKVIPAGTPVLLYQNGSANTITLNIVANDSTPANTDGDLTGTYLNATIATSDFVLGCNNSVAGFYNSASTSLKANSAYIKGADAGVATSLVIDLDTPTGLRSTTTDSAGKLGGALYNLWGQPMDTSYKGIIIRNGKKVLNK